MTDTVVFGLTGLNRLAKDTLNKAGFHVDYLPSVRALYVHQATRNGVRALLDQESVLGGQLIQVVHT